METVELGIARHGVNRPGIVVGQVTVVPTPRGQRREESGHRVVDRQRRGAPVRHITVPVSQDGCAVIVVRSGGEGMDVLAAVGAMLGDQLLRRRRTGILSL